MLLVWNGKEAMTTFLCGRFFASHLTLCVTFSARRYVGTVSKSPSGRLICVQFDEGRTTDSVPASDVKRLALSSGDRERRYYPAAFFAGDVVDAKFQDGAKWYRGRIAAVSEDGNTCDII